MLLVYLQKVVAFCDHFRAISRKREKKKLIPFFHPNETKISWIRSRLSSSSSMKKKKTKKNTRDQIIIQTRTCGVKSRRQQVLIRGFFDAVSHLLDPGLIVHHGASRAHRRGDLGDLSIGRERFVCLGEKDFALAGERRR